MRPLCVAVASLLLLGALAERPQFQGRLEAVEVRARGHLARKKETAGGHFAIEKEKETCWGDLGESHVAKDAGRTLEKLAGKSLQECMDRCAENSRCKSLSYKPDGESCFLKDKRLDAGAASKHVDGVTTYFQRTCTDEESDEESSGSDPGDSSEGGGGSEGGSASIKVVKFKPDIQCNFDDEASGRAEAQVKAFASEGYDIVGLIEAEHEYDEPDGYWYAAAQCQDRKYGDPVIIFFKKGVFEWVDSIGGQTAKVEWSQAPYVGGGGKEKVKSTGIAGYSKAQSCTANYDKYGVRAYAGAKVKHLPSGQEICVLVGTFPHGGKNAVADWYNQAIRKAGCKGKPMITMYDQNHNGKHKDFDKYNEWGQDDDPGYRGTCQKNNGDRSGCTCCLQEGMGFSPKGGKDNWGDFKYDRIVAFTPDGSGKVEDFQIKEDWVCKAKGEHKITSATVKLG